jgi:hypothetical protein
MPYLKRVGAYGLLAVIFTVVGDGIALLLYPGFDITKKSISMLCNGPGGVFFQLGAALTGVFTLLCTIYLGRLINEEYISESLRKTAVFSAIISSTCLIILGLICGRNPIVALLHGTFALFNWIFGLVYIALYSILLFRHKRFSKVLAYYGFVLTFFMFISLILWLLFYIPGLHFLIKILPLLEWIATFGIVVWYFLVSMYALFYRSKLRRVLIT